MFSGNSEVLQNNFDVDFSFSGSDWKAVLLPKDNMVKKILQSLSISGKAASDYADLNTIVMSEANGDSITYNFTNQKYPKELTADEKAYFSSK